MRIISKTIKNKFKNKGEFIMAKIINKIENVKVTGVKVDGRQGKLWHLKKHLEEAKFSLRRVATEERPNNIYVVAHLPNKAPFYIGTVPGDIAFWLAPKMDAAMAAAKENGTKVGNEYYVNITNVRLVCGDKLIGARFDLLHEITKTVEKAA